MAHTVPLLQLYRELLTDDPKKPVPLYVVPLIRYSHKRSDYLYLLYQEIIENHSDTFTVESVSVWQHWKFVWQAQFRNDVVLHYHWLECTDMKSLFGMGFKLFCIIMFKLLGCSIVWTLHNKMPHDRKYEKLNFIIRSKMARRADLIHIHCKSAIPEMSRFYSVPESKFRVIPHPEFPSTSITRDRSIQKINKAGSLSLRTEDTIFLMFGNISAYKQIDKVCELFKQLPDRKKLLVVGPVKKGQISVYQKILSIEKQTDNIFVVPHFIPEAMVPFYMNAADCLLFNYRDILTSGGVELAKSYNRPIIAPSKGCLTEMKGKSITLFSTQSELASLLSDFERPGVPDA